MNIDRLLEKLDRQLNSTLIEMKRKSITVHIGGHNWETIVDVVFCQECDQYHIISEKKPL